MKTQLLRLYGIYLVMGSVSATAIAKPETISFRSDFRCPYVCRPESERPGYMVEVLRHIFEKKGYKIEVKINNWLRSIKDTRSNKAHGVIACRQFDANDFIFPKRNLGMMQNGYFTLKTSTWKFQGRKSLQNKRIGVVNGYSYGDSIDKLIKARHKSFVPFSGTRPLEQIIHALKDGQLDGFIETPLTLHYSLAELKIPADILKLSGWVANQDPYLYVAFSPNNKNSELYAEFLSKGIDELRRSGELQRILGKYHLRDWERKNISLGALDDFSSSSLESPFNLFDVLNTRSL